MQHVKTFLLLALLGVCQLGMLYAQPQKVIFKSGTRVLPENASEMIRQPHIDPQEVFRHTYYRYLQFQEIPRQSRREQLERSGITLLSYIPNNTYLAAIPENYDLGQLAGYNLRSISPVAPTDKIDPLLTAEPYPDWALSGDRIQLVIRYHEGLKESEVRDALLGAGVSILKSSTYYPILTLMIPTHRIEELAMLPFVHYVEPIAAPDVPDALDGRGLQRANAIDTDFPSNRNYDGSGIKVLVRDDGAIGPHIDFQGRLDQSFVGASTGTHGDGVAGIFVGAGNLDPRVKGMASGAFLYTLSYQADFLDQTLPLHQNDSVMITNSSYSNGCNAGYTTIAQTVDEQIFDNKSLMHCFSGGNSNGQNCFGAGTQWGNITGGHKMGKNVIATANLDGVGTLQASSSRGPASDGRIKPDISAHGANQLSTNPSNGYQSFGGTSAAAPSMAGVLTQLYQAYREKNANAYPNSGLMKAILLNTANEMGNPGPDFQYGWGLVNGLRALEVLEKNYYFSDTLTQGNANTHTITVPTGTQQVRIMTYWMDPEGSPSAAQALVNNLDMTVTDPASTVHNPWILNPAPNAATLGLPATTGVDNLNNVEQVAIDAPTSGTYTLTVTGTAVPQGPQEYFVVYIFIMDEIKVTYPLGGEGFVPGETENIHWEAYGNTGNFTVEYTTNDGTTWNTISTTVAGSSRLRTWTVPAAMTGQARVRVTRGALSDESDQNFSIAALPQNIQVTQVCPGYTRLTWSAVAGATGYDIFMLGAKYMDSVATSTTTTVDIMGTNPFADHWFSVRATGPNSLRGRRANAVNFSSTGLLNCVIADDVSLLQIQSPGAGTSFDCQSDTVDVVVRVSNGGVNAQTGLSVSYQLDGGPVINETITGTLAPGATVTHTFATPVVMSALGTYSLNTWTQLINDGFPQNDSAQAVIERISGTSLTAPFTENFETQANCSVATNCGADVCPLTNGWTNLTNGAGDDIDWRVDNGGTASANTGPSVDHNPGTAAGKYLYLEASGGCTGQTAVLISPCIDLTPTVGPQLSFWYHMYGASMGELHLDVFSEGAWIEDVISPLTGDQGNSWNQVLLNLSPYAGGVINLRFRGVTGNDFASDMAIDDIGIVGALAQPVVNFSANTLSACPGTAIQFSDLTAGIPDTWAWSFSPNTVTYVNGTDSTSQNPAVAFNATGVYEVILSASNSIGSDTLNYVNYIDINAGTALDVIEDFQTGTFPPANWNRLNPDGDVTWQQATINGSTGGSTVAAYMDNYSYNAAGAEDVLGTMALDLTSAVFPSLSFDVAYAPYSATLFDGLRVDLSTDCGQTFTTTIYNKSGTTLATVPFQTATWSPANASQWRRDSVLLTPYVGNSVVIRFVNVNGYGNSLYLDHINIADAGVPLPAPAFTLSVSSLCQGGAITFSDASVGSNLSGYQWDFGPGAVPATATTAGPHTVIYTTPGPKTVSLAVTNPAGTTTATQAFSISPLPIAGFTSANPGGWLDFAFTNTSTDALVTLWNFGDGNTSNVASPTHTYAGSGLYTVQLIAVNSCGNDTLTQVIEAGTLPPSAGITASATAICENDAVLFTDGSTGDSIQTYLWDFGPGAVPATAATAGPHTVVFGAPGVQNVQLIISNPGGADTVMTSLQVDPLPDAVFAYTDEGAQTFQFSNTSSDALSYLWDFGNDSTSTLENPMTTYLANGSYTVQLIATNACGSDTSTQVIDILNTGILTELAGVSVSLFPNPNAGIFSIRMEGNSQQPFHIEIRDLRGRVVQHFLIDQVIGAYSQPVNVSHLAEGVYSVAITSGGASGTLRFVKK